ncbi:MAG: T9SS type A sorting domain-containing protein [Flavobacteriales bacterium]|nr:T9SS type A sorting domain-containing protein [Flavobacteriales bacterium]
MKKLLTSASFVFVLCLSSVFAQNDWQWMMHDHSQNLFAIQADFQLYYDQIVGADGKIPKGTGIKQFKRWEYYWENRVDADGNFPPEGHTLNEMERWFREHGNSRDYVVGSGTWELLGPSQTPANGTTQLNGSGRLNCIAFHPTDVNTIYAGAPSGGFWTSTDNGSSWTQSISGLTRLGVSSIVIHPTTPTTIYIGTGDRDGGDAAGYGVWRSTDGGATWSAYHNGMPNTTVGEIIMDPNNSSIMYAACHSGYIYRTTDGGANWSASNFLGGVIATDLAFHPTNSSIIYAGTLWGEFWKSVNSGVTFTKITSGLGTGGNRVAIAVSPDEPNYVYALIGGSTGLVGIYRSTNSGTSFSTRTTTPNILGYETDGSGTDSQSSYDLVIAADPSDAEIIYTGGVNLWKSINGGSTMTNLTYWVGPSGSAAGVHADQHALEFSPHSGYLYNGNDGGVYVSADAGDNFTDISDGLNIAQIYKIGVSQQTYDLGINGYQDNGTAVVRAGSFSTEIGGDGMECIIDPTNDSYMYGALYYGSIKRSSNGGTSFSSISTATGEDGGWVTPYKLDPNDANRMFAGYVDVWRTDNVKTGTPTWSQISSFAGSDYIRDVAIAPSNSSVMYVSRSGNKFYRSNNATAGSPTWTDLSATLPGASSPKDIEIDPTNAAHLYIAFLNDIYESTNSGASWTNVSGTLPDISLNTIVIDKNSPNKGMYVGMDVGVYYDDNVLSDWVAYNTGLPNIEITELEIHDGANNCKGMLYGATYGQGFWKSDLKDPGGVAPVACFEASTQALCASNTVTFTEYSSYAPTSWAWTITPGTFAYIGGTTANSQHPQVQFNSGGTYDVSLTATNATGNGVETKNSYITVWGGTSGYSCSDNLESYGTCSTGGSCNLTCALAGGLWNNLTNGTDDDVDWRIDVGGTPTGSTGPSVDDNPGTAAGKYAYLESSSCNGKQAILESDCIELDSAYNFSFAYHMYGATMGELHVDLLLNGTWINDLTTAISGDQGNTWVTRTIDLSAYEGSTVKIRFRGITGSSYTSDMAIDDIKFRAKMYWLGTTSTDWNTVTNWNKGVLPTSSDEVYITSVPSNQPVVTSAPASPATCGKLNISSGATLTVNAGKAITVSGATSNGGTILVKANAAGIGSFIDNGTIAGAGAFQMEQYLTGAGGGTPNGVFYYVSNPATGATAASYNLGSGNKLWSADEFTQSYPQITNGATVLNPAQGYVARMGATGSITFGGTSFNTGNQSAAGLTRTGNAEANRGYNLVGNPYPSTVSWNAATKTNLETTLWYRTRQGSTMLYDTYNATGSVGTNNNGNGAVTGAIAPTQGFWVRVEADGNTGTLSFTNAMRSHGTLAGIYRMAAEEGTIRMTLSNGTNSDEAILVFDENASDDFDAYDSHKFWAAASVPQLYMNELEDTLVINGLYSTFTNPIVDLGVKLPTSGNYTLNANDITIVGESVFLEDRFFNIFQDLMVEPSYSFSSNSGNIGGRFAIHFGMSVTGVEEGNVLNSKVYYTNGQLNIILSDIKGNGNISVLDVTGKMVYTRQLNQTWTTIPLSVSSGIYLVKVETEDSAETHRIIVE